MSFETKLIEACSTGDLKLVKYLIENTDVNIHIKQDLPFRIAIETGQLEVVKWLVKNGANVYARNDYAFRSAIDNKCLDIVIYLRSISTKWKCKNCLVRMTCLEICENYKL